MIVQCFRMQRLGMALAKDRRPDPMTGMDDYVRTLIKEGKLEEGFYIVTRSKMDQSTPTMLNARPYTDAVRLYWVTPGPQGKLTFYTHYPSSQQSQRVVSWPPKV